MPNQRHFILSEQLSVTITVGRAGVLFFDWYPRCPNSLTDCELRAYIAARRIMGDATPAKQISDAAA
jgi:hypothetical protein